MFEDYEIEGRKLMVPELLIYTMTKITLKAKHR